MDSGYSYVSMVFVAPTQRRRGYGRMLMQAILHDPFDGIGKPEPLKYLGADIWSRRITQEHRCVYLVRSDRVEFLQGRYHY